MSGTPYGHWPSPLTAAQAASGKVSLSELSSDGTWLYWLESRPSEDGRVVFVRSDGDGIADLSPQGVSIRSRVHEYGGGASCLVPGHGPGAFAFVDLAEQRVWLSGGPGETPKGLSSKAPDDEIWAHGGLRATSDGAWVLAVRAVRRSGDGSGSGSDRPRRCVVALGTRADNAGESVVAQGHDFYGAPSVNEAGDRMVTTVWDHPDMPWDASEVIVVPLVCTTDEATRRPRLGAAGAGWTVAGGAGESVGQPAWRHGGGLRFVSDRRGWWQPYGHDGTAGEGPPTLMTDQEAEFHGPDWVLAQTTMVELTDGSVVARRTSHSRDDLVHITGPQQTPTVLPQPCVAITAVCRHGDGVAYLGGPPDGPDDVWVLPRPGVGTARPLRPHRARPLAPANVSVGEPFELVGRSGRPVHGVVYPPTLEGTAGSAGTHPPLVVTCHGGPTASAGSGFDITTQYFTSRGFAVALVNYAGSTGYGRAYRCSLWGQWGVADAEDCVDAAQHLAASGRVDGARMAIRGGSAGGMTALNALAAGEGLAAAVAHYGVTDLVALATSTHDFEAHYLDRLIGPLPACREVYEARSPVRRAADMNGAVLLLQGADDPVVPPAQAERLRDALVAAGRPCVVRFFEGESHGFRRAETLVACLEEELAFYRAALDL